MVLLKNQRNILPLKPGQRILLTGTDEIHSGTGSGFVKGYDHVSYEQGLRAVYGDDLICQTDPDRETVRKADVVLFRLNKPAGEGLDIPYEEPADQLERLRETAGLNKNVIVLINACNVMPMDWLKDVRGVVWCYFLGQERGTALAARSPAAKTFRESFRSPSNGTLRTRPHRGSTTSEASPIGTATTSTKTTGSD